MKKLLYFVLGCLSAVGGMFLFIMGLYVSDLRHESNNKHNVTYYGPYRKGYRK